MCLIAFNNLTHLQFFTTESGDAKIGGGRPRRPRRPSNHQANDADLLNDAQQDTGDYDTFDDVTNSSTGPNTSSFNLNLDDTLPGGGSPTPMDVDSDQEDPPRPQGVQADIHRRTQGGPVYECLRLVNIGGTKCW